MSIVIDQEFKQLIPPLSEEEYRQLEANIIADGCSDALKLWGEIIIDGHNRYDICTRHGIEFKTVQKEFSSREDAMDWMDANQLGRRNLKPDQFTLLLGRRYNRAKKREGRPVKLDQNDPVLSETTAAKIAREHGVGEATVKRAGQFAAAVDRLKDVVPDIVDTINTGNAKPRKDVIKAAEMLETRPDLAVEIIKGSATFAEIKKAEKKEAVIKAIEEKVDKQASLPVEQKVYRVIYADPPWQYSTEQHCGKEQETTLGTHYPSMSIDELKALPVGSLADTDAVLFMWATSPLLPQALDIINAWGFTYKASMVWDKVKHNVGHYVSVRHELLLIATRGSCTPDNKCLYDSVHSEERTEHSVKPEHFRKVIDDIYRFGDRIELFARRKVEGWDLWGNQL